MAAPEFQLHVTSQNQLLMLLTLQLSPAAAASLTFLQALQIHDASAEHAWPTANHHYSYSTQRHLNLVCCCCC
jgi:hypothetical protein